MSYLYENVIKKPIAFYPTYRELREMIVGLRNKGRKTVSENQSQE